MQRSLIAAPFLALLLSGCIVSTAAGVLVGGAKLAGKTVYYSGKGVYQVGKLTVRAAEKLAQDTLKQAGTPTKKGSKGSASAPVDAQIRSITNRLREHLATHVAVHHGAKKGKIEIEYYGDDDLQRLLDLLGLESE